MQCSNIVHFKRIHQGRNMLIFKNDKDNFNNKYVRINTKINSMSKHLKRKTPLLPSSSPSKQSKISLSEKNKSFLKSLGFTLINNE